MSDADVTQRIRELCRARGWTVYRLAKASGLTYSTLNTMLNKGNLPSLPTLQRICEGFGVSLSQFFSEEETAWALTERETEMLGLWDRLTAENKDAAEKYLRFLLSQQ